MLCLVLLAGAAIVYREVGIPFVGMQEEKAIGLYVGASPFDLKPSNSERAILTAEDIHDVDAEYVTDPFVVERDGEWYMFLGVRKESDGRGAIGLAESSDGRSWEYQGIVLEEEFHTSFPHVVESHGEYYMIPESEGSGAIRLYRATRFPTTWKPLKLA